MSKTNEDILYREVQRLVKLWIIGVFLVASIFWWGFIQQVIFGIPFEDKPMGNGMLMFTWLLFGILFPWGAFKMKLVTEVRREGLFIRFVPFHFRYKKFRGKNIQLIKSITYSLIERFDGWGIRINFEGERAYNMGGNQGVELRLSSGSIVVIGSQKPYEFEKALFIIA